MLDTTCRAPFTMQRIAELLIEPDRYYTNSDKFLRGVEKVRCLCSNKYVCID